MKLAFFSVLALSIISASAMAQSGPHNTGVARNFKEVSVLDCISQGGANVTSVKILTHENEYYRAVVVDGKGAELPSFNNLSQRIGNTEGASLVYKGKGFKISYRGTTAPIKVGRVSYRAADLEVSANNKQYNGRVVCNLPVVNFRK